MSFFFQNVLPAAARGATASQPASFTNASNRC